MNGISADLVQSRSTTDVSRSDGSPRAQTGARNLVKEDVAEIDVGGGDDGVGDNTAAASAVCISAAQATMKVDCESNVRRGATNRTHVLEDEFSLATPFKTDVTREVGFEPQ